MADSKSSKTSTTDTQIARVEGTDDQGRPRLLRVFYAEDDYQERDDRIGRDHVRVTVAPTKG